MVFRNAEWAWGREVEEVFKRGWRGEWGYLEMKMEEEVLSGVYGLRFLFLSDLVSFWEFYLISTSRRTELYNHIA